MSGVLKKCCCFEPQDLYYLRDCSTIVQPAEPKYLWKRRDVYALETGDDPINVPDDWVPNRYAVWLLQNPACSAPLDKVCGKFTLATLYAPVAITTNANALGYNADYSPALPVTSACQYASGPEFGFILGGTDDILAWMTPDSCCSDDCGNFAEGEALACELYAGTGRCGLPLSVVAAPVEFSSYQTGSFSQSTPWGDFFNASVTVTPPPSWTIAQDPGGAYGTYQLTAAFDVTMNYSVITECWCFGSCGCGSYVETFTVTGQVIVSANALVSQSQCNFGQQRDLFVTCNGFSGTSSTVVDGCNTTNTTERWKGGLLRVPFEDDYCYNVIRFDSGNDLEFSLKPVTPTFSSSVGCVYVPSFNTVTGRLWIRVRNPLGPKEDYCP